jgi:serine phosphatase RsbU (regulator of sigma subunit)
MGISALLFVALLDITGSDYTFILLPVFLSLFITGSRLYPFNMILNSTPLYLLLTFCLALVYYGVITVLVLLTHYNPDTAHIIFVTTALAWAIILEPARGYIQSRISRRFNVRNREAIKAVEAFTSTLREEIDLDQLRERFLTVIEYTMQPYSVSLWVCTTEHQQEQSGSTERSEFTVAGNDPIIVYALSHPGAMEVDRLQLDSPVLQRLKTDAVEIALPLVSQGELIGLLALGPRLKRQEYAREDRALLNNLATQVAPALRVAQMVYEQQEQVREHERIEQELRTAQAIQHAFLPKDVPALPGWQLMPYYQPAREVGGDFYDIFVFADGRLGLVIGDVSGKGVPAALVMATVHTMLRTAVQGMLAPGEVLARVNDLLAAEIPAGMFVTCFYALLDPGSGRLRYANAGHEPPYRQHGESVTELWATGMPLGLLPGSCYEEQEATLTPGESLLFYSDGLVEAHSPGREMFGFPRLQKLLEAHPDAPSLIGFLLGELQRFTGEGWEQEDDVTLLLLQRLPGLHARIPTTEGLSQLII